MAKKARDTDQGIAPQTGSPSKEQEPVAKVPLRPVPVREPPEEVEQVKLGLEEALLCYDHFNNHLTPCVGRDDPGATAYQLLHFGFRDALIKKTGLEHSQIGRGTKAEELEELFAGIYPPYFFLGLRLYPTFATHGGSPTDAVSSAVDRLLSIKDTPKESQEFCEFFGEPGVFEAIACLTKIKDGANISSMLERVRRNISRPEGDIIPLLSDAELPPPPSDGRASKVERRIRASALPGAFEHIEADLVKLHDPVVARFQKVLDALHQRGGACATFEDNQELTRRVVELADRFGIRLFFDTPDRLRHEVRVHCVNTPRSAAGVFRVQAANKKNTQFSSSPSFPHLIAGRAATDQGADAG
jgi:hypothetical protein